MKEPAQVRLSTQPGGFGFMNSEQDNLIFEAVLFLVIRLCLVSGRVFPILQGLFRLALHSIELALLRIPTN